MTRVGFIVLDVPEFAAFVTAAKNRQDLLVERVAGDYLSVSGESPLELTRSETGLCEAIWFAAFTGGLEGVLESIDEDHFRIIAPSAVETGARK